MPIETRNEQITKLRGEPNLAEVPALHTQAVDEPLLAKLASGLFRTMELDISSREGGEQGEPTYYIGHDPAFYHNEGLVYPPPNVSLDDAMWAIVEYGVYTKLDIKNAGAIPKVVELAQTLGPDNCMLHAYIPEVDYQVDNRKKHWPHENVVLKEILKLRVEVGNPALQVSCRGFTYYGIANPDGNQVYDLNEVFTIARKYKIDVVNLNLPDNQIPPNWVLKHFSDNGVLIEVYEDRERQLPCDVFTTIEVE